MRVLVAYATRYGSTAEVARAVAETLSDEGAEVDVQTVARAGKLTGYDAVVVGTSARMGHVLPESLSFVRRHRSDLQSLPAAYFLIGLTMREDTPANRRQAESYLTPLFAEKTPVATGLFGGVVDMKRLGPLLRFFFSHDKSGTIVEGDFRDWDAIRSWAHDLGPILGGKAS